MKRIYALFVLLVGSLAFSIGAQAGTYSYCNTSGCQTGGSPWSWFNTYDKTRYPIVLAHGMSGFAKIGPVDYWYQIPQSLARNGAQVFVTQVASFNDETARGEQLLSQVQQILAITGAQKVNLIGHSQGSMDVRYVAGVAPQLVASVTTLNGPNKGSAVADLIQGVSDTVGPNASDLLGGVVNGLFSVVDILAGHAYEQDALAGLQLLTTSGMQAFNTQFPAGVPTSDCGQGAPIVNGIRYYSWSGTGHITNVFDPVDYALALLDPAFSGQPNDGLVSRCSSHLGLVLRDNYNMNHLDTVNQLLGLISPFEANPVALFRIHANRLKRAGL